VADLVPEALASGMTKREVAELAGVSALTLDAVLRRRSAETSLPGTLAELERALHRAA
jgi:transcriptional regulator with XRE-family HTH domain